MPRRLVFRFTIIIFRMFYQTQSTKVERILEFGLPGSSNAIIPSVVFIFIYYRVIDKGVGA